MSLHMLLLIFITISGGSYILNFTILQALFWFLIKPKIEKRYNKKLTYDKYYEIYSLGKFICEYYETTFSISTRYICYKLFNNQKRYKFESVNALEKIGYDILTATPEEIFISLLVALTLALGIISLTIGFLVSKLFMQ